MSATSTEMTIETTPLQKFQCVQKVQDIPTINSASLLLFDLYGKAKGMHPLLSKTLGYCETTSENMITPLMTSFEKPLQTVDSVASQGIEYITNKYPIVKKEPQEILQTTVKPAVDKIQGVKEYGQVKIQTVMKKGQEQADIILDNKPARMALTGLQTGLMGANDFLNQYYPLESDKEEDTDEKVTVKATVEKPKNPTGQAVLVFSLLLQLNAHIYGVMKQQMTRIHELTMSKLNQLTGVITMMETAKAEGKAGEGLVGKAKELSGSLLHFYTETAHSLVSKFPSLVTTYFDFVRCEMQQLFDVFAKAETISDIPSNMLTFTKKSVETTQSTMVKMYKLIKGPEGEAVEKKDQ